MSTAEGGSDFARTRATRTQATSDPLGKAALFSTAEVPQPGIADHTVAADAEAHGRGASHLFSQTEASAGTLVVDCSRCAQRTRVSYAEFAALHLPLWAWVPLPGRTHRHWLRCPACRRFTWLRARWLE